MSHTTLLWFRQDLRLSDQPALAAALARGAVVPVFIWSPETEGAWAPGGASRWWLHHALADLASQLSVHGGKLLLRAGDPLEVLRDLARETGADAVYWNRRYEPLATAHDRAVKAALRSDGLEVRSCNASLLFEPWEIATGAGAPYRVFTPFSRTVLRQAMPECVRVPLAEARFSGGEASSLALEDLGLLPAGDWAAGFSQAWEPTRAGGEARLAAFLERVVDGYDTTRDLPGEDGTSRLSPYLHWGQLGPREVASAIGGRRGDGRRVFFNELLWREFGHHVLFHFPHTAEEPLQEKFLAFPWARDAAPLRAWQRGRTGYPIVDAGMRQLWATGWMHNRVRMVAASFLVKHLLQPWQEGARWFWDTLVDADLASNSLGWQWAGGCGADAAPYFRIFNPMTQGRKFDADGAYVRRWVPELSRLPDKYLHAPWEAPAPLLERCGIELGRDYPRPVVDHVEGRERALAALQSLKEAS
jgi:deoxyribodipyrimidine photo-lyase